MKKSDTEVVYCCACSPFKRFYPPDAAEKAREHYESGKHEQASRAAGLAVHVDA